MSDTLSAGGLIPQVGTQNPLTAQPLQQQINPGLIASAQPSVQQQPVGEQINQFLGMQHQMLANKDQQLTIAAQQRIGQIQQQSIDPQTGQIDWNRFAVGVAADPTAAYLAPQALQAAATTQGIGLDDITKTLVNAKTHYDNVQNVLAPLMDEGNAVNTGDALKALATGANMGLFSKDEAMTMAQSFPPDQPDGTNPQLAQLVQQMALRAAGATKTLDETVGNLQQVGAGGVTDIVRGGALTPGGPQVVGSIGSTPTPSEAGELVQVTLSDGTKVMVPRASVAPMMSISGSGAPVQTPGTGGQGIGAPVAAQNPLDQQVLTQYIPALNQRAQDSQTTLQNYQEMMTLNDEFVGGASQPTRSSAAALAQKMLTGFIPQDQLNSLVDGIANGNYAAMQEFEKLATVNAVQALHQAGGGEAMSQEQISQFQKNLPNVSTDPRARAAMLGYMEHLAELPLKEQQAWEAYKNSPAFQQGKLHAGDFPSAWSQILQRSGRIKVLDQGMDVLNRAISGGGGPSSGGPSSGPDGGPAPGNLPPDQIAP